MNFEQFYTAVGACGIVVILLNYVLDIPKVKEFIPLKIRNFIYFLEGGLVLLLGFLYYRLWVLQDGWGTVLLAWGVFVVILGILVIAIKIFASIRKKSTDNGIDL